MGGIGDFRWVNMIVDEVGFALTKVDKTIQKSINLLTEFTEELFDDQPRQDSGRKSKNGKSGEENSSSLNKHVAADEVKESRAQHWAMCFSRRKQQPIQQNQHWSTSLTKIPVCMIKEQRGDKDYHARCGDDYDDTVAEYFENMSNFIRSYSLDQDDRSGSSLKCDIGCEQLDDQEEEEDETKVSESCENMSELELGASATNYSPSCYHHHNEECSGSSLKCRNGYELLKDVESWDGADEVEEYCYSESTEVMESLVKHTRNFDVSNESLVVHDGEDVDVSDEFEGFVDVKTLSPEDDWVYVTKDY